MPNIIHPRPWERDLKATDETVYRNRRQVLKQLGLGMAGMALSPFALNSSNPHNLPYGDDDNTFNFPGMSKFYPARRNEAYKVNRNITEEYAATHYNNFYEFIHPDDDNIYNAYKYVDDFNTSDWSFKVSGMANNTGKFDLEDIIKKFGLEERTYRFRCVERWAMAVPWTGIPFQKLIKYFEPKPRATHLRMTTYSNINQMPGVRHQDWYPWPYFEGLRMDEAMNELSFLATGIYGKPLPKQNGAPMRLVVPWKYGYKSIKSIVKIDFIAFEPETFWHKVAPNEYGFISNVNPNKPHPRWSQKYEQMIPDGEPRPTLLYNGYEEYVGHLY